MARRLTLKRHLEDAELRVQRAQRRLDREREAVAALERAGKDAAKAASEIADDCVRRHWIDCVAESIRLREAGRRVAVDIRKAIISKEQSDTPLSNGRSDSEPHRRQQTTAVEKLQREIHLLGTTIDSNAAALRSKTMSDEDREALQRQINVRTAHKKLLEQRLDRLS